jgi:hypothetical protein
VVPSVATPDKGIAKQLNNTPGQLRNLREHVHATCAASRTTCDIHNVDALKVDHKFLAVRNPGKPNRFMDANERVIAKSEIGMVNDKTIPLRLRGSLI